MRAVITQNSFIALEEVFRHSGRIAAASHLEQNLPLPQDDDFRFADPVSSLFDVGTHRHAQSTIETSHRSSDEQQCASALSLVIKVSFMGLIGLLMGMIFGSLISP